MNRLMEKWLVEEVDARGQVLYSEVFETTVEAYEMYKQLTEARFDTVVSVTKQTKKLLTE